MYFHKRLSVENQINIRSINVNGRSVVFALAIIVLVSEVLAVVFHSRIIIVEVGKRLIRASVLSFVVVTTVRVKGVFVVGRVFGIPLTITVGILIVATSVSSLPVACSLKKVSKTRNSKYDY